VQAVVGKGATGPLLGGRIEGDQHQRYMLGVGARDPTSPECVDDPSCPGNRGDALDTGVSVRGIGGVHLIAVAHPCDVRVILDLVQERKSEVAGHSKNMADPQFLEAINQILPRCVLRAHRALSLLRMTGSASQSLMSATRMRRGYLRVLRAPASAGPGWRASSRLHSKVCKFALISAIAIALRITRCGFVSVRQCCGGALSSRPRRGSRFRPAWRPARDRRRRRA
jgi:hypothetical protein